MEAALILDEWCAQLEAQGELDAKDDALIRERPFGELDDDEKAADCEYSALYSRLFSPFPRDPAFFAQ